MPNTLGKNLHLCFSLIKRPQPQITHSPQTTLDNHIKSYNSLYEDLKNNTLPPTTTTTTTTTYVSAPASPSSVSTDYMETEDITGAGATTPDLTAAYASRRFFISSPGRSNSIVDSLSLSSSTLLSPMEESSPSPAEVAGGVPVQTYSPDPYVDFRRSMQEMVESRDLGSLELKEAWEYLQELLLSYLALNPKNTHKYIVGAFTDLVVSLMSPNNNNEESALPSSSSSSSFSSSCLGDRNNGGEYV